MLKSQSFTMKIPWPPFMHYKKFFCFFILNSLLFLPKNYALIEQQQTPQLSDFSPALTSDECPQLIPKYFANVQPKAGSDPEKIIYVKKDGPKTKEECVQLCCVNQKNCNIAFMYSNNTQLTCFHATCSKDESCLPVTPEKTNVADRLKDKSLLVLVRPNGDKWPSSLESNKDRSIKTCELNLQECGDNEVCQASGPKSRSGTCQCLKGFSRSNGKCVQDALNDPEQIEVQVYSKTITLPENKAVLTAYAIPEPAQSNPYNYEWSLISSSTNDQGEMVNRQNQTLSLSSLQEGIYQFKVVVSGGNPPVYGEGYGNVTVLPPERVNQPPKAVLIPPTQLVILPTNKAVIDASGSTDDTKELAYKWEIMASPMGYHSEIPEAALVTLENLLAGNYTIKVTVTDSDGAFDSAMAKLQVIEEKDYPPSANAGEDVIIYLPNNEVTLHGNQSSDDHGIVSWEWTLNEGDKKLAADTKDMRTQFPHISNLEEGVYSFHLKVTDGKSQTAEDDVNVYVKAAINQAPVANAGKNHTLSLPQNWIILDGSQSSDDTGSMASWTWSQVSGPNQALFLNGNASIANATNLTKGSYVFQLLVQDQDGNSDKAQVYVHVNQDNNAAPVAEAGLDVEVTLPQSVVIINGSASHDDLKITKWRWKRDPKSLAAGKIVGNSSQESVLYLVNLVPGHYIFNLKVWDEQGKSSEDAVSIHVKDNPNKKHVIQAILEVNLTSLTQNQVLDFSQGVSLLLKTDENEPKVTILNILPQENTNYAILQFIVELKDPNGNSKIKPGIKAVEELMYKLRGAGDIIGLKLIELDTLICQNDCSGHGFCKQESRTCVCESFWIENFIRRKMMDGKSNCEWSVIYVGIFISFLLAGSICGVIFLACKKGHRSSAGRSNRSRKRYTKLEQNEDNFELRNPHTSSLMISDSDTDNDEEIIFDSDLNRTPLTNGGNGIGGATLSKRNGAGPKLNARA